MPKTYEMGDVIFCSTEGCFGGTVQECEGCGELYMSCPCGCSTWDDCICGRQDHEEGEALCIS